MTRFANAEPEIQKKRARGRIDVWVPNGSRVSRACRLPGLILSALGVSSAAVRARASTSARLCTEIAVNSSAASGYDHLERGRSVVILSSAIAGRRTLDASRVLQGEAVDRKDG